VTRCSGHLLLADEKVNNEEAKTRQLTGLIFTYSQFRYLCEHSLFLHYLTPFEDIFHQIYYFDSCRRQQQLHLLYKEEKKKIILSMIVSP